MDIVLDPWGSQDILLALEADDPGSNPGGSALQFLPIAGIIKI